MRTWPTTRLRYVAHLNPSIRTDLLSAPETEVSFLPMEAIGEDGSLRLNRNRPVSEVRNGYTYFEDGDVVFAKVTPCFENGKGALMRNLQCGAGFGTSELTVLRPRPGTNAGFLNYVLQSEPFRRLGAGAMTGAGGLKRVPDDFTRDFVVAWPDAAVQEFVANFLDEQTARIDALIAEKEKLKGLLSEQRAAFITSAVAGEGVPGLKHSVAGTWPTLRLRYVAELNPSVRADLLNAQETPVSFLPMDAIGEQGTLQLDKVRPVAEVRNGYSYFENEDVVFAKVTPCFENGKGAVMRELAYGAGFGTTEVTVLRPKNNTNARFLYYVLATYDFRNRGVAHMTGAGGLKRVPDDFVRDYSLPWPSVDEQLIIADYLDKKTAQISALCDHADMHIGRLREYRSSLISAAVTGQLDINSYKEAA